MSMRFSGFDRKNCRSLLYKISVNRWNCSLTKVGKSPIIRGKIDWNIQKRVDREWPLLLRQREPPVGGRRRGDKTLARP